MLATDRFQPGSAAAGRTSRSLRREKSPHRSTGSSKAVAPDLRPRGSVVGGLLLPSDGARGGEGTGEIRRPASPGNVASGGNVKIPAQHNMQGLSRKTSGTPIKILMEEEMEKVVETRRHSPSVIAKLMGLDPLPARQPCSVQKKQSVVCSPKGSSQGSLEKHISYEERMHEFKDIFEVLETKPVQKPNWHAPNGLPNSRQRDHGMANIQQKFMDAKCLSMEEKLQNSEEFSEALEVLDSCRDPFPNFLEEPASLFKKQLRGVHSVPSTPEASQITILKFSNVSRRKNSEICQKSEKRMESNTPMGRNAVYTPEADIFTHCLREHTVPHSRKLAKPKLEGNMEASSLPTRIVVLKPNLEKVQNTTRINDTSEDVQLGNLGYRRRRESKRSGSLPLFLERREGQKLSDVAIMTYRTKGSKEIAKEVTKHMRHTVNSNCLKSYGPRCNIFPEHDNLHRKPGSSTGVDFEAGRQISGPIDGWNNKFSSYLTENCASREARKRLSERWMMTHKFQEGGLPVCGSSTLGEMLALSDRETPDMHTGSLSCQERSPVKYSRKKLVAKWTSPSGISSSDGWKDGWSSGLPRSKSVPASSTIYGCLNPTDEHGTNHTEGPFMLKDILNMGSREFSGENAFHQRFISSCRDVKICLSASASQPSNGDEEENKLPVREIHVDQDGLQNGFDSENSSVEKFVFSESSASNISDTTCLVDSTPVVCDADAELPCLTAVQQLQSLGSSSPATDDCFPANYDKEIVAKETSCKQRRAESHLSRTQVRGQAMAEEVEHPSPISVLEPPDENEYATESFERVSADLHELRMKLKLLKLESRDIFAGRLVGSDDDAGVDDVDVPVPGVVTQTCGNAEDRDFNYVLNVLENSGFNDADQDVLISAFYSPESPVCPGVFEKLEKVYSVVTWSRAERKLLFDVLNSILADILAVNMDLHPWVRPRKDGLMGCKKSLTEEVWQSVRRQKQEIGDASGKFMDVTRWLDFADDIDWTGREIERMLKDDLLEELVSEIVSLYTE
uniref:Intraflagellar transport protein 81 n=1 Tax=Anthurium amnicola TaxID=1678845 RepID=A0A1D1Y4X2_9ARAE